MNPTALFKLSYGVYVVSSMDGDRPTGCTANSAMQITSSPATMAVSINHNNFTNQCIEKTGKFSVSVLSEKSDPQIIGTFGFQSGREVNKFDSVAYEWKEDMPVVKDACAYMVCKVINKMETDTHTIFLGEVLDADHLEKEEPMTYAYYHKVIKGKSPKNAPTYIPDEILEKEEKKSGEEKTVKYVCSICGYVYTGETPFEELPDDFKCPICKQPKSVFVKKED